MKDFSKYQGIIPAFYACYDASGAIDPAAAKQRAVRRVDYRVHALMRDIALNYLYNSHYAILTSTLLFSADSMICDELSPRRAMMPSAI